jgi:hypothetical protein
VGWGKHPGPPALLATNEPAASILLCAVKWTRVSVGFLGLTCRSKVGTLKQREGKEKGRGERGTETNRRMNRQGRERRREKQGRERNRERQREHTHQQPIPTYLRIHAAIAIAITDTTSHRPSASPSPRAPSIPSARHSLTTPLTPSPSATPHPSPFTPPQHPRPRHSDNRCCMSSISSSDIC